jgi:hypothetical protein
MARNAVLIRATKGSLFRRRAARNIRPFTSLEIIAGIGLHLGGRLPIAYRNNDPAVVPIPLLVAELQGLADNAIRFGDVADLFSHRSATLFLKTALPIKEFLRHRRLLPSSLVPKLPISQVNKDPGLRLPAVVN